MKEFIMGIITITGIMVTTAILVHCGLTIPGALCYALASAIGWIIYTVTLFLG